MSNPTFVADELVTASKMNQLPKGWIGYAQVVANQASITTEVDLTGLSVTVTVAAGRRIKVSAHVNAHNTSAGASFGLRIKEGTTQLADARITQPSATFAEIMNPWVVLSPTAGAHTYKLSATASGSGVVAASATSPAAILVEDLGAV